MVYDLGGGEAVVIKVEGFAPLSFLDQVHRGAVPRGKASPSKPEKKDFANSAVQASTPKVR